MKHMSVVAFDVIETTFSLQSMGARLDAVGVPGNLLQLWFARLLRDTFAMAATDTYAPFSMVAGEALKDVARERQTPLSKDQIEQVLSGFSTLEPHQDAEAAFRMLKDAGVRIVTLTNGAVETTRNLLRNGGLLQYVERNISTDEVSAFKPNAAVYRLAAAVAGVPEGDMTLVAAHAWDVHGAKCAGLATGFVARGRAFPSTLRQADVQGESLCEVVDRLLGR